MGKVQKVKLQALVQMVASEALKESLHMAKPKYKGKTDQELAEIFGLTEHQYNHLMEKLLGRVLSEKLETQIFNTLTSGASVEVPHQFNVFLHSSKVRVGKNGKPVQKLSLRTRRGMKLALNQ